jgi:hypothetical protein
MAKGLNHVEILLDLGTADGIVRQVLNELISRA